MGSSRGEELFIPTQQQEDGGEGDDVYLELAKAITERKCRIVQKKEKLRLIINESKKKNEEFRLDVNKKKCLMKELEEISNQRKLQVQNMNKAQESRATLDTSLYDLNNKLSFEKTETKRKNDEYNAAIKDGQQTWESYKEKYENFPLVKKLRELEVKNKKVEIEIKQHKMDAANFKEKTRLKNQIAERRFHLSVVEIAETYFMYQKQIEEHKELLQKITDMKKTLADLKSGKMKSNHLDSSKVPAGLGPCKEQDVIRPSVESVQFTSLGVEVRSPAPPDNENESSGRRTLFDWGNFLGSSSLRSFSKKPSEKKMTAMLNPSVSGQTSAGPVTNLQDESQKNPPLSGNKTGSSLKLTDLLRNISSSQRKPVMKIGHKRISEDENREETHAEKMLPSKKVCKSLPQSTVIVDASLTSLNKTALKDNPPQDQTKKNLLNKENKENSNPRSFNSSSGVQYRPQPIENNQNKLTTIPKKSTSMSQNLMNILSIQNTGNQRKATEPLRKGVHQPVKTIQTVSANKQKFLQIDQQKQYIEGQLYQGTDMSHQNQQFEEMPGSPAPDLIPVETNSLSLSQGNMSQQIYDSPENLVMSEDFISPNSADLDEDTRLVYQRIAAEAPIGQQHTKVPVNAMSHQKLAPEENMVRSQYFTDLSLEHQSLTTRPDVQDDFQLQPYSPIIDSEFSNTNQAMDIINSPPPANIDAFGGSVPASKPSAFSFMPSTSKPKSSVFDLF